MKWAVIWDDINLFEFSPPFLMQVNFTKLKFWKLDLYEFQATNSGSKYFYRKFKKLFDLNFFKFKELNFVKFKELNFEKFKEFNFPNLKN